MKQYLRDLWHRRSLLFYLVISGLKAEHRNTVLGYFWWLLDPLLGVVVYYFLRVVLLGAAGPDYVPFLVIGLVVFRNFSSALNTSAKSIVRQSGIITQVYLPKAMFPFGAVLTQTINFGFSLVVVAMFLGFSRVVPGPEVLWLPLLVVVQMLFHTAIALMVALLTVFVRDIDNVLTHIMRLMRYAAPVIWEADRLPARLSWVVDYNPFAWILASYRNILMYGALPDFGDLAVVSGGSLVVIVVMLALYTRYEHVIIKVL